jgi:hypothetical protein
MKKNIQYLWLLAVIFFAMLIIPAPIYAQPDADDQILTTLKDPPGHKQPWFLMAYRSLLQSLK